MSILQARETVSNVDIGSFLSASNVKPRLMSAAVTLEAERKRGLEANRSAAVEPFVEKQVMELEPLGEDEVARGVKVEPQTFNILIWHNVFIN